MRALLSTIVAAAVLASPTLAAACSCADWGGTMERYERAGVVVHGVVVASHVPLFFPLAGVRLPRWTPRFLRRFARPGATADVEVIQAWKATPRRIVTVNLGTGQCCDCTLGPGALRVGEEVVLFGRVREGVARVGASNCNPPIHKRRVTEALALLGPGITDLPPAPRAPWLMSWLGRIGLLLALLVAARLWFGRSRSIGD